jgi:hypothetical protein
VAAGEIKRLMLFEPPGHAKSTYASVLFPGFYIGRNDNKQLIAASHTADLAGSFGRRVRNLFGADEWPFEAQLAGDSQAADQWSTTKGGGYFAVGVGGKVHGRRADGIIDDPIGSRADADSKLYREAVWNWYKTDLHTRLKPNGFIIVIQTRWYMDDLAGRIELHRRHREVVGQLITTLSMGSPRPPNLRCQARPPVSAELARPPSHRSLTTRRKWGSCSAIGPFWCVH